jgi:hypothetical protein
MAAIHYAEAARNDRPWCGAAGRRWLTVTSDKDEVTCARCRKFLRLDGELERTRRGPCKMNPR